MHNSLKVLLVGGFTALYYSTNSKSDSNSDLTDIQFFTATPTNALNIWAPTPTFSTDEEEEEVTAKECVLTTYIAPEHGFVNLGCSGSLNHIPFGLVRGFYPAEGNVIQMVSSFVLGHIFGREIGDLKGAVIDDEDYYYRCLDGEIPCAKADFPLTRKQAKAVLDYIEKLDYACARQDLSRCSYNRIGRNCIDFAEDVAKVAGIEDNIYTKLKVTAAAHTPIFRPRLISFEDQAWKYVYLKTWGQISLKDDRA